MHRIDPGHLPAAIRAHLAACTAQDRAGFAATFAPDALVNDARREFLGLPAIVAWADKELFGDRVTLAVTDAFAQAGGHVVRCRVEGDFDRTNLPDPVILSFYFTLQADRIARLVILHNTANAL